MIRFALAAAVAGVFVAGPASAQTAPTAGIAGHVINAIEKVCIPLIKGQDGKAVAQAAGYKRNRDGELTLLPGGVQKITVSPPTAANPTVCSLALQYDLDQAKAVADALTAWAAAQNPPIPPLGAAYSNAPGLTGWSWSLDTGPVQEGLVFNAQRSPDGKPLGKGYDVGTVLFSLRGS